MKMKILRERVSRIMGRVLMSLEHGWDRIDEKLGTWGRLCESGESGESERIKWFWFWTIIVSLLLIVMLVTRAHGDEVKLPRYSATVLGEVVSDGDPYYSFGYNGWPNKKWSIAGNYSYSSWDQEYPEFLPPYDRVDFEATMWGGRVTRWLEGTRLGTNTNTGTGTVKGTGAILIKPYLALEVNRHKIKNDVPFSEILWQWDGYFGAEIFPFFSRKICVRVEGGVEYLTGDGIWVTYNIGFGYYFDSPKKRKGGDEGEKPKD